MKKLLGVLFCFGFLLTAGVVYSQTEASQTQSIVGQTDCTVCKCTDIAQAEIVSVPDQNIVTPQNGCTVDVYKLRQAFKEAASKANEALFYRYSIVPECPVTYIGKQGKRYYNHYCFCVAIKYNQPPNYTID